MSLRTDSKCGFEGTVARRKSTSDGKIALSVCWPDDHDNDWEGIQVIKWTCTHTDPPLHICRQKPYEDTSNQLSRFQIPNKEGH